MALGPMQEAVRMMALHLPKPASPAPTVKPFDNSADTSAEGVVLRRLMSVMGHAGDEANPAQQTTVQSLMEALTKHAGP